MPVARLLLVRGLLAVSAGLLLYLLHKRRQRRRNLPPSIPVAALPLRLQLLYPLLGHGPLMATPLLLHKLARAHGP
jgi:hypothetical protein